MSLDYIQVPVLPNFELFPRFSLQAGPSFNFLVDEKSRNYRKQNMNDFEFGGAVGASYKLYSGLFADFRYHQGFTDVFIGAHSRNSGFQLALGYMF
ncbi:MAG: outer membrane beta-barrel protein [Salegentibacter sp.]